MYLNELQKCQKNQFMKKILNVLLSIEAIHHAFQR